MPAGHRARILIVDDSAVMRSLLRSVVIADPALEVAGTAADGQSALGILDGLRPDLVLLDVEMPVMDGLATLRELRARGHRMPVIVCSSLTQRGARVTIEALAGGASDYVAKPAGKDGREAAFQALSRELLPRIHALAAAAKDPQVHTAAPLQALLPSQPSVLHAPPPPAQPGSFIPSVLVIGASTGGPAALDALLPLLPAAFPLPVLVVQHMPELFTRLLAERLAQRCRLRVREAAEGDRVHPGVIHIARGNWHLEVLSAALAGHSPTLHLTQAPPENHCRPAVDVLFRSAAAAYGAGVLAVVLTGMGSDGLAGCRVIRARGGAVLAQDRETSTIWGMPGAVAAAGLAHRVLPLPAIAPEILRLVSRTACGARATRQAVV
ncbi:MAG: chemotaxis-specific protein-glutamate methyltransferase CheB [Acidobacteriota bacterium]|nr:chemotaxis-specific protein-glutamate methyltransferase CheB [Acidobacteriota bacterium]